MPQVGAQRREPAARTAPARSPRPARPPWCGPAAGHSRSIIWCSVTSALTGGISVTCRRSIPVSRRPPARPAAARSARLMPEHVIRMIGQLHRHARLALRPARLAPGLLPQRLRRRLGQPVRRRRLEEFFEFCFTRAARSATSACSFPDPLPPDARSARPAQRSSAISGIPLRQQLTQPRVRRAQPRDHLIGRCCLPRRSGRTGHKPHPAKSRPSVINATHSAGQPAVRNQRPPLNPGSDKTYPVTLVFMRNSRFSYTCVMRNSRCREPRAY